ncbi:unnamed protein product [Echinostoma caproni]|uniref:DCUN1 domain-containing protein n=1 Tax=Echinostoma caproni TaxID=27848 RepID=A0A183AF90_9TREM|nr:unnamed protein product [Echinostoma caproni]
MKGAPVMFLQDLDLGQRSKPQTALDELGELCEKWKTDLCIEEDAGDRLTAVELSFLSIWAFLFDCWGFTPIQKDLEKYCGAESSFVPEGTPK